MFKSFFSKQSRVIAFVQEDGTVELFDGFKDNHPALDFVEDDLSIIGMHGDVQVKKINIYEDVCVVPDQMIYSLTYGRDKRPAVSNEVPQNVYNAIWNFLEGGAEVQHLKKEVVND